MPRQENVELARLVDEYLDALHKHALGDLSLGRRHCVWAALGRVTQAAPGLCTSIGHKRRFALARSAVLKVMQIWNDAAGARDLPLRAIRLADRVMDDVIDRTTAAAIRNEMWTECDDLCLLDRSLDIISAVAYGALQVVSTAIWDECFNEQMINLEFSEYDEDWSDWDASFFAAAAYSGGPVWIESSSRERRVEFWEWWLREAAVTCMTIND